MSGFSFGTPTTQAGAKPTGLNLPSFGNTQAPNNSAPSFSFGSPSNTSVNPAKPAFPFVTSSAPSGSVTASSQPAFGFSSSSNKTSAQSTPFFALSSNSTATTASTTSSLSSLVPTTITTSSTGFDFGNSSKTSTNLSFVTSAAAAAATTTSSTSASSSGFSFGLTSSQPSTTAISTTTSVTASGSTTSLTFGTQKTGIALTTTTPSLSTSAFGPFSLGNLVTKPSDSSAAVSNSTLAPASAVSQPSAPSTYTYRQLEELVNKWTYELDEQSRNFESELCRLNKADALLIANADKISDLHAKVEACKAGQYRIDQELEFVESQQRALEDLLEPLEQAVSDLLPSQQHADAEREAIFQMCINTDLELGQLLSELREMAERVNAVTAELEPGIESHFPSSSNSTSTSDNLDKNNNVIGQLAQSEYTRAYGKNEDLRRAYRHGENCVYAATTEKVTLLPIRRVLCNQSAVRAVRFNADGQYCLTAGGNRTIRLWNPEVGRLLKTYTGHGGEVSDVQAASDSSLIGSGGADTLVVLWDVATGQSLRRWRKHAGRVNAVRFAGPAAAEGELAPSSSLLLFSVGVDGMLFAWDARARTPYPIQTMHEAKDSVNCLTVRRWHIITGSVDRCVRVYDVRKGIMTEDYIGSPVTSVGLSFDNQCLLVASQDSVVRLFDYLNGELLNRYTGHVNKDYRIDCCLLNDDAQIASGSEDSNCRVVMWNLADGAADTTSVLDHSPCSLAWSSDIGDSGSKTEKLTIHPVPFIHSLSPHPSKNALLTAGGDYFWLWSDTKEENDYFCLSFKRYFEDR
nr:WD repeat domain containing protein 83 [Hymenolepis microstoma]